MTRIEVRAIQFLWWKMYPNLRRDISPDEAIELHCKRLLRAQRLNNSLSEQVHRDDKIIKDMLDNVKKAKP
jgi:hypothetical protein